MTLFCPPPSPLPWRGVFDGAGMGWDPQPWGLQAVPPTSPHPHPPSPIMEPQNCPCSPAGGAGPSLGPLEASAVTCAGLTVFLVFWGFFFLACSLPPTPAPRDVMYGRNPLFSFIFFFPRYRNKDFFPAFVRVSFTARGRSACENAFIGIYFGGGWGSGRGGVWFFLGFFFLVPPKA